MWGGGGGARFTIHVYVDNSYFNIYYFSLIVFVLSYNQLHATVTVSCHQKRC